MKIVPPPHVTFGNLPYLAGKIQANHRFGIDLDLHLLKRDSIKTEPTDKIEKMTTVSESAFLKLLRTELKRPLGQSKMV